MSLQTRFQAALRDAALPIPETLVDMHGAPAGRRFNVYRNNVAVSLGEALHVGFPVIAKLLGEENFKTVASHFLRRHPPSSPLMMTYGAAFPDFLRGFAPLSHIGYLGDVAALELALRQSYHAADSTPIAPDALARIPPAHIGGTRLTLAPSLRLLRAPWPIYGIWAYNTHPESPKPAARSEDVLVTRAEFDPRPHLLPAGAADALTALANGARLDAALAAGQAAHPDFDLGPTLTLLLGENAITGLTTGDTP